MFTRMRERVTIQSEGRVDDGGGGASWSWADVATVYARVRPLKAEERLAAGQLDSVVGYEVLMRHRSDVTHGMRLSWTPNAGGAARMLNIEGVTDTTERGRFLTLICSEGGAT